MRHINHACLRPTANPINRLQDTVPVAGIQALARFIQHEQSRAFHQRPRDEHQSLLSFRDLLQRCLGAFGEAQPPHPREGDLALAG